MKDRQNTIAGWVLFAGIVALGASIVSGEVFNAERPEKMGYPIEGVVVEGGGAEAEKPIEFYLATADAAKGERSSRSAPPATTPTGRRQRARPGAVGRAWASRSARPCGLRLSPTR